MSASATEAAAFSFLGCGVRVHGDDPHARSALARNFASVGSPLGDGARADIEMTARTADGGWRLSAEPAAGAPLDVTCDLAGLLFTAEKHLILEVQRLRPSHLFLHAAAVEAAGTACLLVAASGGGKSILCWRLLQEGFPYLSDELVPVETGSRLAHPYAHALCLKAEPPSGLPLPAGTMRAGRTLHVPADLLPAPVVRRSVPLGKILFLEFAGSGAVPALERLSRAAAAARLYPAALNPLAHPGDGLDAVVAVVEAVPAWRVRTGDLDATAREVAALLRGDDSRSAA